MDCSAREQRGSGFSEISRKWEVGVVILANFEQDLLDIFARMCSMLANVIFPFFFVLAGVCFSIKKRAERRLAAEAGQQEGAEVAVPRSAAAGKPRAARSHTTERLRATAQEQSSLQE